MTFQILTPPTLMHESSDMNASYVQNSSLMNKLEFFMALMMT